MAKIVTVTKIGESGTVIQFKINDGFTIPDAIKVSTSESFRMWQLDIGYVISLTNDQGEERSMSTEAGLISWATTVRPTSETGDRFRIDSPCIIETKNEV